jgi:hypothetical protein
MRKTLSLCLPLIFLFFACHRAENNKNGDHAPTRDAAADRASSADCPAGMRYYPGGRFLTTRTGDYWGFTQYWVNLRPFCLAEYEASQPTATASSQGQWDGRGAVPPAQIVAQVLPWSHVQWIAAAQACARQGWRLPAFEELQYSATSGDPRNLWYWGPDWDCREAEKAWAETCRGGRPAGVYPTGGPTGESKWLDGVYDLLGNVSEYTSTPWQPECYRLTSFVVFGGAAHTGHDVANKVTADPQKPGTRCKVKELGYALRADGEHPEDWRLGQYWDDGFRCAADPGPPWRGRLPLVEAPPPSAITEFYYDRETGRPRCYQAPVRGSNPAEVDCGE